MTVLYLLFLSLIWSQPMLIPGNPFPLNEIMDSMNSILSGLGQNDKSKGRLRGFVKRTQFNPDGSTLTTIQNINSPPGGDLDSMFKEVKEQLDHDLGSSPRIFKISHNDKEDRMEESHDDFDDLDDDVLNNDDILDDDDVLDDDEDDSEIDLDEQDEEIEKHNLQNQINSELQKRQKKPTDIIKKPVSKQTIPKKIEEISVQKESKKLEKKAPENKPKQPVKVSDAPKQIKTLEKPEQQAKSQKLEEQIKPQLKSPETQTFWDSYKYTIFIILTLCVVIGYFLRKIKPGFENRLAHDLSQQRINKID